MGGTIYMVGLFTGAILSGIISDAFGRKLSVTLSLLVAAVAQCAAGFAQNYISYVLARFVAGIGNIYSSRYAP